MKLLFLLELTFFHHRHVRLSRILRLLLICAVGFGSSAGYGDEPLDEHAYALQSRKYHMRHEFHVSPGFLPLDAYQKGITANASYSYHINDAWGVEAVQFSLVKNMDTKLQYDLERLFGIQAIQRESLKYIISSNLIYKPIYRKMILFGKYIMHGETFFNVGGGFFKFDQSLNNAVDVGIGFRMFFAHWLSMRFDARDYVWFGAGGTHNVPMLSMGLSLNLGS